MNLTFSLLQIFCAVFIIQFNKFNAVEIECDYHNHGIQIAEINVDIPGFGCDIIQIKSSSLNYATKIESEFSGSGDYEISETNTNIKNDEKVQIVFYGASEIFDQNSSVTPIDNFDTKFCEKFENLENVFIIKRRIISVNEDALKKCQKLRILHLSGNSISDVPRHMLHENTKLENLTLEWNKISKLSKSFLKYQKELKWLNLSGNQIVFLPKNIFKSLTKLKYLNLGENLIRTINSDWFANQHNLRILNLKLNQISNIAKNSLHSLIKLEELNLDWNQIEELNSDTFVDLISLKLLSLGLNNISYLPENVFSTLIKLEELSLNGNQLTKINSSSFGIHENLTKIYLSSNKIESIDEKLIDNTAVATLSMNDNICCDAWIENRSEMNEKLKICFENFNPRPKPVVFAPFQFRIFKLPNRTMSSSTKSITRATLPTEYETTTLIDEQEGDILLESTTISEATTIYDESETVSADAFNSEATTINTTPFVMTSKSTTLNTEPAAVNLVQRMFDGAIATETSESSTMSNISVTTSNIPATVTSTSLSIDSLTNTETTTVLNDDEQLATSILKTTSRSKTSATTVTNEETTVPRTETLQQSSTDSIINTVESTTVTLLSAIRKLTTKTPQSDNLSCGKPMTGHGVIIRGADIVQNAFPWIAALTNASDESYFCGGTLVSNQKVITAAHCIYGKRSSKKLLPREMVVSLGIHDLAKHHEVGKTSHVVQSIKLHDDWKPMSRSFDADIAVLVLDERVTFTRFVQPICLLEPNSDVAKISKGVVLGYGKSEDESKKHENIPKILDMPILENEDCFLENSYLTSISSKRTFCGGYANGSGVCSGDSGSGVFVTDGNAYYLRGIVSASLFNTMMACNVHNRSVFTNVLKFYDWINNVSTESYLNDKK